MNLVYEPVPNQKFDIGRTINFTKCNCSKCDFMHCPKNNYSVKQRLHRFTVKEFFDDYKDAILAVEGNKPNRCDLKFPEHFDLNLTYDLIVDFFEYMQFRFPQGLYWEPSEVNAQTMDNPVGSRQYRVIELVRFNRKGQEQYLGSVKIKDGDIFDSNLNTHQYNLAKRISKAIVELKSLICREYYYQILEEGDNNYGWLSPTGEFYPCGVAEHTKIAYRLSSHEHKLECEGWVRIVNDAPLGAIYEAKLSAEQRNWLSIRGYELDE